LGWAEHATELGNYALAVAGFLGNTHAPVTFESYVINEASSVHSAG